MCLDTLDKKFVKPPKDQVFVGYKVMYPVKTPGKKTQWEPLFFGSALPEGAWRISRTHYDIFTSYENEPYPSGFHIYKTRKEARTALSTLSSGDAIVKVEFSHVLSKGIQHGLRVLIAKRIKALGAVR